METRRLGNTDMDITPIGFGAWALGGGGWAFSWGPQNDQDSIAAIHRVVDLGVNWIDTAAVYGLGHSEEVVGQALKGISLRPYVFTKCGRLADAQGKIYSELDPASIRRECEASLRRLQTDVIDLYQLHWPNPDWQIEEAWTTLADLQREGKVRWIGISNFGTAQMERIAPIAPISSLQPRYSLVRPEVETEILPYCRAHNIGVIVYAPMMSGLLTGAMTRERIANLPPDDWRRHDAEFQEPRLSRNLALVDKLRTLGKQHDVSPGVVAIAWTLHNPAVTGAIVGARNPKQVDGIIAASEFRLSEAEFEELNSFIHEYV